MQARQDPAVPVGIEQREREALVAAGLLERVVPDQPGPLEGARLAALEDLRAGGDVVELAGDLDDLVQVRLEDGLETLAVGVAGQADEAGARAAGIAGRAR